MKRPKTEGVKCGITTTIQAYAVLLACAGLAPAQIYGPPRTETYAPARLLQKVGISQKMGAQVPLDLPFVDESGRDVTLRQYLRKPVVLALVYYQCPSLCNMVLNGILRSAKSMDLTAGHEYEVIAVSFDPRETPEMAAAKKKTYLKDYKRYGSEQGWHFLTGPETSSKALADAVGFHYVYDAMTNQYAHSSAIMVLTPAGRIARYFYGIDYPARDVRLGLVEASGERIGKPSDQILLYCFHYDPTTGKYALVVMNVLRLAALITLSVLVTFLIVMLRRDYRTAHQQKGTT
jgi:protein SCO1